jgi:hypothetical protein
MVKSELACSRGGGVPSQDAVNVSIAAVIAILIIEKTPLLRAIPTFSIHSCPLG